MTANHDSLARLKALGKQPPPTDAGNQANQSRAFKKSRSWTLPATQSTLTLCAVGPP